MKGSINSFITFWKIRPNRGILVADQPPLAHLLMLLRATTPMHHRTRKGCVQTFTTKANVLTNPNAPSLMKTPSTPEAEPDPKAKEKEKGKARVTVRERAKAREKARKARAKAKVKAKAKTPAKAKARVKKARAKANPKARKVKVQVPTGPARLLQARRTLQSVGATSNTNALGAPPAPIGILPYVPTGQKVIATWETNAPKPTLIRRWHMQQRKHTRQVWRHQLQQ